MSDLVAIAYDDLPTAQQVASNLGEAVKGHDIELDDLVIVERKDDGKLLGMTALFIAWRDLDPEFGEEPEMGWIFATEAHGKGLAAEACRAVLDWAETNLDPTPIWAIIAPANEPSLRLAGKLGFERLHETLYHQDPTVVLKRPAW